MFQVPARPHAPDELLEKPEVSSQSPAHAHQLGSSSSGAPRHSQPGQAWPRHLPDPSAPHGLTTASLIRAVASQALSLTLGRDAAWCPNKSDDDDDSNDDNS